MCFRPFDLGIRLMIRNIVFDMGNVLVRYDPEKTLRKYLAREEDIHLLMKEFYGSGVIGDTDRGVKTYENIIDERAPFLPQRLVVLLKKLYLDQCYGREEMPVFPEMYDLVALLKKNGYRVYLLSNAGVDFYQYSPYIPAIGLMDGKIVSSDYKLLKPEKEIYETLFRKYALLPAECVFIDDMPVNIEGAERCGMEGICFSPSWESVSVLKERLRNKGIQL